MATAATLYPVPSSPLRYQTSSSTSHSPTMSSSALSPHSGNAEYANHPSREEHEAAQKRIQELEQQVRILTTKASAAVDKLADYEDELRQIRRLSQQAQEAAPGSSSPSRTPSNPSTTNRISNFIAARRLAFSPPPPMPVPSAAAYPAQTPTADTFPHTRSPSSSSIPKAFDEPEAPPAPVSRGPDLRMALSNERTLREAAEEQVRLLSHEIEDLSVTLFSQANEMVATERKARARLEERVAVLEKRDEEKRKRLEMLEGAMKRVERVRAVLGEKNV